VTIDGLQYDAEQIRAALGAGFTASEDGGGLDLTQTNADGSTSGVVVDADGYTDVVGARKPTALDFSRLSQNTFSETLDGGVYNTYLITRDASGRISSISDAEGHETVIAWGA
ncbi:MAG: hypothetical protein IJQ25_07920, partial [Oscillibacter sp.]|nr:hypothetical protein [Oscillibacter sp.]